MAIPFECGNRRYSRNLIKNLARLDKKNEYLLFSNTKISIPNQKNFKLVLTPKVAPFLNRQFFLSFFAMKKQLDLFHFLTPFGDIFLNKIPVISTVHDVKLGYTYPIAGKFILNRIVSEVTSFFTTNNSKRLIVPTLAMKKELSAKNKQVDVVLEGVDDVFLKNKRQTSSERNLFLAFADFNERKNTRRIFQAYAQLPNAVKSIKLAIVISRKDNKKRITKLIKEYGLEKRVLVYSRLNDMGLVDLYDKSIALVYPSIYEGFGLPIVEAMARGTPVITSNFGACSEVSRGASILVDPYSVLQIKSAMQLLIKDRKKGRALGVKGKENSKKFSWRDCARHTLEIYRQVYKSSY